MKHTIDHVYYLFNNGYNYESIYRIDVWTGELSCYFGEGYWSPSDEKLNKLLDYGNGKRSLEQLTEEEAKEQIYKYDVLKELTS